MSDKKAKQLVRFDWAMKNILRNKANFDILEGFLTCLLNEKITVKKFHDIKNCNIIECVTGEGIPRIVSVDIVYHSAQPDKNDDYIYHGKTDVKGMHTGSRMVARFEPELLPEQCDGIMPEYYFLCVGNFKSERVRGKIDEWLYFFKTESIKASFTAPGIKAAEKKLGYLKMSELEQKAYDRYMDELHYERSTLATSIAEGKREGRAEGRAEGEAIGLEKGELKAKLETAHKFLAMGLSAQQVADGTGLTISEVEKLAK